MRRLVLGSTLESARERTACGGRKEESAASALGVGKTMFCDFLGKYVWTGLGRGYGDSRLILFWAFTSGFCIILPHISGWILLLVTTYLFFGPGICVRVV